MDKSGAMYFCGDKNCLKHDSKASKSLAQKEKRDLERDAAKEFSIGSNYINAALSKWIIPQHVMDLAMKWVKNPEKFLVYQGIAGAGKTYFCAAVANFLFKQKRTPMYIHIRDFIANCKKTFDNPTENSHDYTKLLAGCDILIVDDLGSTMNTEYHKEAILALIDIRYSNNAPTVITTNFDRNEMVVEMGERITRRIFDESILLTKDEKYAK